MASRFLCKRLRISKVALRNTVLGLLFASPWIIGFLIFTLYPVVASLYYSCTQYNILTPPKWVGLENYKDLLKDELFWTSLYNTLYMTIIGVPVGTALAFAAALLLNLKVRGIALYRTVYYLPSIVPLVVSSILWMWFLNPRYGPVNFFLSLLGLKGPGWLADPAWSKAGILLMGFWWVGGPAIIFLAGLQDIPAELYESAELDGANWWQKTWNITLPMLTPVILFNAIVGTINYFQTFARAYIMTEGGPINSTLFYVLYLYRTAFEYLKMGYASAMAWILLVVILIVTLILFTTSAKWVYYGGESR